MDDFLGTEFGSYQEPAPVQQPQQQQQQYQPSPQTSYNGNSYQQKGGYQQKSYNGGGYQQNGGFKKGGGGFKGKPDVLEDIYMPIALVIDEKAPQDAKEKMFKLADSLIAKGYTIRFNADDIDSYNRYKGMSQKCEDYGRWKSYNNITSTNYWNGVTPTHYATKVFSQLTAGGVWEKWREGTQLGSLPGVVKDRFIRDMRILMGQNNRNNVRALIVWSQDGAYLDSHLSKDTGDIAFIIGAANEYGWKVLNINNPECHEGIGKLLKGKE